MQTPADHLTALDRVVHEPARLAILTALRACGDADFLYLQRLTGCTPGNLSGHLRKLEEAGLIAVSKGYQGKVPQTILAVTDAGRQAIDDYWHRLHALKEALEAERGFEPRRTSGPSALSPAEETT